MVSLGGCSGAGSGTGTTTGTGGVGGTGGTGAAGSTSPGGAAPVGRSAFDTVSAGQESKSATYEMVITVGEPTQARGHLASSTYEIRGGVLGVTE